MVLITIVPTNVMVTTTSSQEVAQLLSLLCEVTAMVGFTSIVDIMWMRGQMVLQNVSNVTATNTTDDYVMYMASYDSTTPLTTFDDNAIIECIVVINSDPPIINTGSIELNVTGKCSSNVISIYMIYLYSS